ncbi:bifunctional hydroxymethylpyrimidine kinase/phosphomethylpyrimidine kinase [Deinococcus taeanensis]|uniref:bifunctional hydroxymethylpyrimidine kinase/phosphomethylpyrimidine kinase n=1 Tax=Deinococcus taeanensis TaxID=2737050 RepID=UPI001CDCADEE|nr:bifunctional hydroxymethylpyrimidine kinase/phosphomethylpyrimidine kinase [Deinococcus taeanensis]UBV42693.1 bifunctional hydroxymethylpyrimidine kinase/phosphomethylpyrimidine kinase [Deinococcus taeanensis]
MSVPVALSVAGSDSGGGAGIQADLKTFEAHGVYGASVLTVITAQNTRGVQAVHTLSPALVAAQLRSVLDDFPVAAVKTGALGSPGVIRAVAQALRGTRLPLIVDPVMLAKSGDALLEPEALDVLIHDLLPLATLVTPNVPEWAALRAAGAPEHLPLLLKGGHAPGDTVTDELRAGSHQFTLAAPRQKTRHTHGTGCTLSAAITANLARGRALPDAVRAAHGYLQAALRHAPGLGAGHGPLGHRAAAAAGQTAER